ncbi:MAG: alpha-amylase family glycosyl hydrolase [Methylacidiphilales bacterium]|nr:alpha-amylase family glycosyl hydrolase [Candidatus Methylacidiphilales bacterium]MDW8348742.1 alpha-amylase family glycosyl hydrolase [Verrucomicrobiae bacterium]
MNLIYGSLPRLFQIFSPVNSIITAFIILTENPPIHAASSSQKPSPTWQQQLTRDIQLSIYPDQTSLHVQLQGDLLDTSRPLSIQIAIGHKQEGSAIITYAKDIEGSTTFLSFRAIRHYNVVGTPLTFHRYVRSWEKTLWSERQQADDIFTAKWNNNTLHIQIPRTDIPDPQAIPFALWIKDMSENNGWGRLIASSVPHTLPTSGDAYLPQHHLLNLSANSTDTFATLHRRHNAKEDRLRIYQLLVRTFSNINETRKPNGTLKENGVGKFNEINDAAIQSLKQMGFNTIWLTGVIQQATATDYSEIGQPADDVDLLKGLAGSPYAIRDYFDVCPDYAQNPKNRLEEFKALVNRLHQHDMKALIDFVPNHVARSYYSDVAPEHNFGTKGRGGQGDDRSVFFDPNNNFFYLEPNQDGPPLKLPTCDPPNGNPISPTCKIPGIKCDGLFEGEMDHGKVTGNNQATWRPDLGSWYETIKLNYGFHFLKTDIREYPHGQHPDRPIPDTWRKMDAVIAHWQKLGVDGFRCDMAHMVPPEFWRWLIDRARERNPHVIFIAEAYNDDPAKVPSGNPLVASMGNVMIDLLEAGFDSVYDDPTYDKIKDIYDHGASANEIEQAMKLSQPYIFHNSLRYGENHDEIRIASPKEWGGGGMNVGRSACGILYGLSSAPLMLYHGQEVGEPAIGAEGFGGDDGRTTIFDYWSVPELVKWVNNHSYDGGLLSPEQKELRAFYSRLITIVAQAPFKSGHYVSLQNANRENLKVHGSQDMGRWLFTYARTDGPQGKTVIVIANLHKENPSQEIPLTIPQEAAAIMGLKETTIAKEILSTSSEDPLTLEIKKEGDQFTLLIPPIPPLTPYFIEFKP